MDNIADWNHRPEPDRLFITVAGAAISLQDLRHLDPGFHEVFRDQLSYHAMVEVVGGRRYVLLQDQVILKNVSACCLPWSWSALYWHWHWRSLGWICIG